MKVLAFGTYDRGYPRNAQVVSALRRAGVDVVEENRPIWEARSNWSLGASQALRLMLAEGSLLRVRAGAADAVLVGYPGHFDLTAARRVARGRPVVFNPLVSLDDTLVGDRGRFAAGSVAARLLRAVDRHAFRAADHVVADTEAHAAFFRQSFGLARDRVSVCFVGAEDRLFAPGEPGGEPFHVLFVGKLIPLHGIEVIIAAARRLPEVPFRIVGTGQLDAVLASRPANVEWVPWIAPEALGVAYRRAGCALGIFATTAKAGRVIPNKAFQSLACACPLVTASTPAARELLTDGLDAMLVPAGDPAALAGAIGRLATDRDLRRRIGEAGRRTYVAQASEDVLGARWAALFERLVGAA